MSTVDNMILEHLKAIRADVGTIKEDAREIKSRLTSVEAGIGSLKRDSAEQYSDIAAQHVRYDRLAE